MNVFETVAAELAGRFVPNKIPPMSAARGALTLHEALRVSVGTDPEWALVSYANHAALNSLVGGFWDALNAAVSTELNRPTQANAWSLEELRTEREVIHLLGDASQRAPDLMVVLAVPRPRIAGIGGMGKPRGTICTQLAHLHSRGSETYGSIIAAVFGGDFRRRDVEVIGALDALLGSEPRGASVDDEIAVTISRSWNIWARSSGAFQFGNFVEAIGGDDVRQWSDERMASELAKRREVAEDVATALD